MNLNFQTPNFSADRAQDSARLVALGMCAIAPVGTCEYNDIIIKLIDQDLAQASIYYKRDVFPYIIENHSGLAIYGYAVALWAIDLYHWALTDAPKAQRQRIINLLLGYSYQAILQCDNQAQVREHLLLS